MIKINRALVSLSNKTNIDKLAALFQEFNIEVISTGGTAKQLKQHLPEVIDIEEITSFPEILGGRVKTLHPHVHGGILARKDNTDDMQTLKDLQIDAFDLVVINLYPFEEQLLKDGTAGDSQNIDSMVELIDIGGITLLRAAAKNYRNVILITDPQDYDNLADELRANNGSVRVEFSAKRMAAAFARSSAYDRNIANYFAAQLDQDTSVVTPESTPDNNSTASVSPRLMISADIKQELRYGENPHQQAALYTSSANHGNDKGIAGAKLLNGKALSYNNLVDANAAWRLACELPDACCVIVKHAQPCGVAVASTQPLAYQHALMADKESSFGGIVAVNSILEAETATLLKEMFLEVIIAPQFSEESLAILRAKKNLRLLQCASSHEKESPMTPPKMIKTISGGFLMQAEDKYIPTAESLEWVTKRKLSDTQEITDLLFAWQVAKVCHSNAIVIAKDGTTCGIGAGQTSRVFSVRLALLRAADNDLDVSGSAVASDAFFPFADSVGLLAEKGIKSIIQPGGSKRDAEVIALADEHNIAMAFTGYRCFYHG